MSSVKNTKDWLTDKKSWEFNQSEQIRQEFDHSVPANKIIIVFCLIISGRMDNNGFEYDLGGNSLSYKVGQASHLVTSLTSHFSGGIPAYD